MRAIVSCTRPRTCSGIATASNVNVRSIPPLAVLAFCVGAAYWPGIYSGSSMPKWWVMAAGLAIIPWGFRKLDPVIAACAASGVLMAGLSLLVTPHLYGGILQLVFMVLLCGVAVGAAALEDVGPVIAGLAWGASISVAASVLQFFGWYIVPHTGNAGFYLNSEVMGELAAPLFIWAFWSRRFVLAGIMATSVAICNSRIAVFVVVVGLIYGWGAPRRVKLACVAALAIGAAASVAWLGEYKHITGMTRIMYWGTAVLSMVPGSRGLAWWHAAHPFPTEEFVHSDVLQAMVEIGLGAVFFLAIPVMVMQRSRGIAERAAYIGICVEALVSFPLHLPATGFLAAVLTGWFARRGGDVRVPGFERRAKDFDPVRWLAAPPRGLAFRDGRCCGDVSDRPAYPRPSDCGPAAREGAG